MGEWLFQFLLTQGQFVEPSSEGFKQLLSPYPSELTFPFSGTFLDPSCPKNFPSWSSRPESLCLEWAPACLVWSEVLADAICFAPCPFFLSELLNVCELGFCTSIKCGSATGTELSSWMAWSSSDTDGRSLKVLSSRPGASREKRRTKWGRTAGSAVLATFGSTALLEPVATTFLCEEDSLFEVTSVSANTSLSSGWSDFMAWSLVFEDVQDSQGSPIPTCVLEPARRLRLGPNSWLCECVSVPSYPKTIPTWSRSQILNLKRCQTFCLQQYINMLWFWQSQRSSQQYQSNASKAGRVLFFPESSQCVDDYAVPRKTETRILVATILRRKPLERPKQMLPIDSTLSQARCIKYPLHFTGYVLR